MALRLLNEKKVKFTMHSVQRQPTLITEIKQKYNWRTMPIVLKVADDGSEKFIGGYTELYKHFNKLEEKNV
jgi:glutaredoxin